VADDDLLLIGRIARAHGNKGQVIVNLDTDFPDERFTVGTRVLVGSAAAPTTITSTRFHQGRAVIGLEGIGTIDEADALAGAELKVPASTLPALPDGTYYRHDLVGCDVQDTEGRLIGDVIRVEGPLEASRLIVKAPQGEVLIPLVADICIEIAPLERRIRVRAPEGLLELNVTTRRNP
jgi:16S rRNA processing protein RimM